ncbi:MAG: hypothetical protein ACYC4L_17950 [Chloroflexota bacterium]
MSEETPTAGVKDCALQFRLVTQNRWLHCHVETTQERLIDLLNANSSRSLPVWIYVSGGPDGKSRGGDSESSGAASVKVATVLFGVPIENHPIRAAVSKSAAWVQTSVYRVRIGLGSYEIDGNIHLPKATGRGPWALAAMESFFAVTDPTIQFSDGSRIQEHVIIVNGASVEFVLVEPGHAGTGSRAARLVPAATRH